MNKGRRLFFILAALLLWILPVVLAGESWFRWKWNSLASNNPFVASRVHEELWPIPRIPENDFSEYLRDTALRDRFRGQGKSKVNLAEPTAEEELQRRFPVFLDQKDLFFQSAFSNVYDLNILSLDQDNRAQKAFCDFELPSGEAVISYLPESDQDLLRRFITENTGNLSAMHCVYAAPQRFGAGYCLFPDTTSDETMSRRWLIFSRQNALQSTESNDIWELPFFTFKKHGQGNYKINALGIFEEFRINNMGFRDADIMVPKPAGTYRILCIGASTTEEGLKNDLTYPSILETLLNQHFNFNRIDVINCGLSGMNSIKHRLRMGDYLALEPDLLVIYNAVNDICHDLFPLWQKRHNILQKGFRESRFFCRYLGHHLLPDTADIQHDIEASAMTNLAYMSQYARNYGVETVICSFAAPHPDSLSPVERDYYEYYTVMEWTGRYSNFEAYRHVLSLYNEALRRLCEREALLYIPVEEKMRDGVTIFGDICHLRSPGIEKKATIIADVLIPLIEKALMLESY
ncbi:MAG: hypothetical protein GX117_13595 [Candidatus Hydrogenedentes bacterium]|nr:hypothetical protein [Candidatus Hydrogenedentota bacterium]